MEHWIKQPNLPEQPVTLAAAGVQFSSVLRDLEQMGIQTIPCGPDIRLPGPVQCHADMLLHHLGGPEAVVGSADMERRLCRYGLHPIRCDLPLAAHYPQDVQLNYCRLGRFLVGLFPPDTPSWVLSACSTTPLHKVPVRQGYAKCSIAVVNDHAVITADAGIQKALAALGIDVLLIRSGAVVLPGYDTGFFGGCCGKLSKDVLYLTGPLASHPDGPSIRSFLQCHQVYPVEGSAPALIDVGGIIPLQEKTGSQSPFGSMQENISSRPDDPR